MSHCASVIKNFDLIIIGAGPAGLAAAASAINAMSSKSAASNLKAETQSAQLRIAMIDDNFAAGGQIWRSGAAQQGDPRARELWQAIHNHPSLEIYLSSKIIFARQTSNGQQEICIETQNLGELKQGPKNTDHDTGNDVVNNTDKDSGHGVVHARVQAASQILRSKNSLSLPVRVNYYCPIPAGHFLASPRPVACRHW